jgi:hypothetical protein
MGGEQLIMDKKKKIIPILQILLILSLGITAITYVLDDGHVPKGDGKVTVVASPKQDKAVTPKWAEVPVVKVEDLGTNLALGKTVTANGFNDVYEAKNVNDGKPETYWEGKPNAYPNTLAVDLGSAQKVGTLRIRLNPDTIWGKRVENFSVLASADGKTFNEILAKTDYQLDPKTGNMVIVNLPAGTSTQYLQLSFNNNSGASAAQVAELEIYAAK